MDFDANHMVSNGHHLETLHHIINLLEPGSPVYELKATKSAFSRNTRWKIKKKKRKNDAEKNINDNNWKLTMLQFSLHSHHDMFMLLGHSAKEKFKWFCFDHIIARSSFSWIFFFCSLCQHNRLLNDRNERNNYGSQPNNDRATQTECQQIQLQPYVNWHQIYGILLFFNVSSRIRAP